MKQLTFTDREGSFRLSNPENISYLYFPLASEAGLKSSVTPNLGGDAKTDQETFLLEPVSSESLHNNRSARNFWCVSGSGAVFSLTGNSAAQEAVKFTPEQEQSELTAGFLWHTLRRTAAALQLRTSVTSFVPVRENVEIAYITLENTSNDDQEWTFYAAIPLYGRSADNIRDHRNVTSLLHRIRTTEDAVTVCPTMSFDEKGHRSNHKIYYVSGRTADGRCPACFYPTVESFLGEGGSYTHPRAVYENDHGVPAGYAIDGREAMGAFRFPKVTIAPGEKAEYLVLLGVEESEADMDAVRTAYDSGEKVLAALEAVKAYWLDKACIRFHTGDADFDNFMRWVSFQPFLRRLFGCSFLPHHDYGRGGRGWRDLWQDCLSLLLMDPTGVGQMIEKNYGGVRIDGTNATIIGAGDGNFIADRNGIARVWMDHALWPLMTTQLYIDQTGDTEILNKLAPYFKDAQSMRGTAQDAQWEPAQGNLQCTGDGTLYLGTILEHLLIQQLAAFYEVGEHNIYRLRGADWNDALDMAAEAGESVAFTCAYAGNLKTLAELVRRLAQTTGAEETLLLREIEVLLTDSPEVFRSPQKKTELLSAYGAACRHSVSGEKTAVPFRRIVESLEAKADWLMEHLRSQEWIDGGQEGWFNSYYDNHGRTVEGFFADGVRMMLTGQVFAIMSGTAVQEQIDKIVRAADHYLYREAAGGYCLNTDFRELKFDMGRMFGFAYGEKENGAVFSHMTTMFANALYRRGHAAQGWKALRTLAGTALDFNTSRIYPGIPEYFRTDGRGMYHYLTGAASWYLMTMTNEVFGVYGKAGDLVLEPKLLAEQFDESGTASISLPFAGKTLTIVYRNPQRKEAGDYQIISADCNGKTLPVPAGDKLSLPRSYLLSLDDGMHTITVNLQ